METAVKLKLRIISLTCHIHEENDADEVFIKYQDEKIWPKDKKYVKMKEGKVPLEIEIEGISKNSVVHIELWEHDTFSSNDHLGDFTVVVNEIGGPYLTDLEKKESAFASYSLEWESY